MKAVFDAANYTGVNITSQASKVIEPFLGMHLFPPLIERAFTENKFVHEPKRGTRDAVLLYVATWLSMLNDGHEIGV